MRVRSIFLVLTGAVLLAATATPSRCAEDALALVAALDPEDEGAAALLATTLGHTGGQDAVPALKLLLDHRAETVRTETLRAAERIGLRSETLLASVRRRADEGEDNERAVALATLGRLGDGRDMPRLLAAAQDDDPRVARAAYEAMRRLTGAEVPFVHARWAYYWKSLRLRASLLLPRAILALDDASEAAEVASLEELVRMYAWTDLEASEAAVGAWLLSPRHALRAIACRLIATLGLADLTVDVQTALRFAATPEVEEAARAALEALGAPAPVD